MPMHAADGGRVVVVDVAGEHSSEVPLANGEETVGAL